MFEDNRIPLSPQGTPASLNGHNGHFPTGDRTGTPQGGAAIFPRDSVSEESQLIGIQCMFHGAASAIYGYHWESPFNGVGYEDQFFGHIQEMVHSLLSNGEIISPERIECEIKSVFDEPEDDGMVPAMLSRLSSAIQSCPAGLTPETAKEKAIELALRVQQRFEAFPKWEDDTQGSPPNERAASPVTLVLGHALDDIGNGQRFATQHKARVRYCNKWKKWLVYDGQRWNIDSKGEVESLAKTTARLIIDEAQCEQNDDRRAALLRHAAATFKRPKREAMLKDAASEEGIAIDPEELDTDKWLLNCSNGTLDLHTADLYPHDSQRLITKLAPVDYDPQARCPEFLKFLDSIMQGRESLIKFLQKAIGYSLTGDTREQVLLILHGAGANGKSTLLNILGEMLGTYALQTDTDTLMAKKNDGTINNDLARLCGARLVSGVETEENKRLAEVKIKQLTGGDTITARFLFQEFFEFIPQFKLFLATNHKPEIRGTDNAIWRRIRLIPFDVTFTPDQQDKGLLDKLRAELPGILAWAVQGCLEWQRDGLGIPEEVKAATDSYREEQDTLAAFIDDCCVMVPQAEVTAKDLYTTYKAWCEATGTNARTQTWMGNQLKERGFTAGRVAGIGTKKWNGIGLLASSAAGCEQFAGVNTCEPNFGKVPISASREGLTGKSVHNYSQRPKCSHPDSWDSADVEVLT